MKTCKNTLNLLIFIVVALIFIPSNVFAFPKDITSINIKNFKEPTVGGRVGDSIPKKENIELKFEDGDASGIIKTFNIGYVVEDVYEDEVVEMPLSPDDKFEHNMYFLMIEIEVDENLGNFPYGDYYNYLGEITINGEKLKYLDVGETEKNTFNLICLIDLRDTISIDDINITIYPQAGTKVKDVPLINSDYIMNGEFLKETSGAWIEMKSDETFEKGKKYKYTGGLFSFKHNIKKDNLKNAITYEDDGMSETMYDAYITINGKKTKVYVETFTESGVSLNGISILEYDIEIKDQITISFDTNGHGKNPDSQIIKPGEKVNKPSDVKDNGLVFVGWFTDKELNHRFDFNNGLYEDTTLYAKLVSKDELTEEDLESNFCHYKDDVYKSTSDKDIKNIRSAKENALVTTKLFTIYGGIGLIPWIIILLLIIGYIIYLIYLNKNKKEDKKETGEEIVEENKNSTKENSKLKIIKEIVIGIILIIIILLLIRGCGSSSLIKTKQTNIDYDNDGICDLNCDKDNDGIADYNIDYDYDCIIDDETPSLKIKTENIILSEGESKNASAIFNYDIKGNTEEICNKDKCSSDGNIKLKNQNDDLLMSFGAAKDKERIFYNFTYDANKAGKTEKYFLNGCISKDNKEICSKVEFIVTYKANSDEKIEYTCPDNYTLENDKCIKTTQDIKDAIVNEYCPSGYTEYNSKCAKIETKTKPAGVIGYDCPNGVLNDSGTKCLINYGSPICDDGVVPVNNGIGMVCKYIKPMSQDGSCPAGYNMSPVARECVKQTNAKCEKGYLNSNFGRCEDSIDSTPIYSCSTMVEGGYKLEGTNCIKQTTNINDLKNKDKSFSCSNYGIDYELNGNKCVKPITEIIDATIK